MNLRDRSKLYFIILLFFLSGINGCNPWDLEERPDHEYDYDNYELYFGGNLNEEAVGILEIDNFYYIIGNSVNNANNTVNPYVLKINKDGQTIWSNTFAGDNNIQITSFLFDDPYVLVLGNKYISGDDQDIYIMKLNSSGDIEWEKTYGLFKKDIAYSIKKGFDDGYYVSGYSLTWEDDSRGMESVVYELNESGFELVRHDHVYGTNQDDQTLELVTDEQGNIFVLVSYEDDQGVVDLHLVKLSSGFDVIWNKPVISNCLPVIPSIFVTSSNSIIVVGSVVSGNSGNMHLVRVDDNGKILREETYLDTYCKYSASIISTPDGGYVLLSSKPVLIKLDNNLNLEWRRDNYLAENKGNRCIIAADDGGYVFVGSKENPETGNKDIYFVKTDPWGNLEFKEN